MDPKFKMLNNIHNASNPHQGNFKRVLIVCSAGLLRSPTAAWVLSQAPYNFNTRAAGIDRGHALIHASVVLLSWADEIIVVEPRMEAQIREGLKEVLDGAKKPVVVLDIPDCYPYRDPRLVEHIKKQYAPYFITGDVN